MNKTSLVKVAMVILTMGSVISANAGLFGLGGTRWKEEVLLHDGSRLVVERYKMRQGRHEVGQKSPTGEQSIEFTVSDASRSLTWRDEYSEDVGSANFILTALHILDGTPYVVTTNYGCLSYNKWGRPNPPYVVFKHDGKAWQRISLTELPAEFKTINLIVNDSREEDIERAAKELGYVSAEDVRKINSSLPQPEYRSIVRESSPSVGRGCGDMIYDGHGGWTGIGWFRRQPSREACLRYCEREKITTQYCPCETLFGGE